MNGQNAGAAAGEHRGCRMPDVKFRDISGKDGKRVLEVKPLELPPRKPRQILKFERPAAPETPVQAVEPTQDPRGFRYMFVLGDEHRAHPAPDMEEEISILSPDPDPAEELNSSDDEPDTDELTEEETMFVPAARKPQMNYPHRQVECRTGGQVAARPPKQKKPKPAKGERKRNPMIGLVPVESEAVRALRSQTTTRCDALHADTPIELIGRALHRWPRISDKWRLHAAIGLATPAELDDITAVMEILEEKSKAIARHAKPPCARKH